MKTPALAATTDLTAPKYDLWKGGVSKAERMRPEADYLMGN
jgi:hypothetical protein